jgi:hypothetical protein
MSDSNPFNQLLNITFNFDSYRPADEVRLAIEERDPIKIARSYAINGQLATTDELEVRRWLIFKNLITGLSLSAQYT